MLLASTLTFLACASPQSDDVRERVQALVRDLGIVEETEILAALGPSPGPEELLGEGPSAGPLLDLSKHSSEVAEAAAVAKAVRDSKLRPDPAQALEELEAAAAVLERTVGADHPWSLENGIVRRFAADCSRLDAAQRAQFWSSLARYDDALAGRGGLTALDARVGALLDHTNLAAELFGRRSPEFAEPLGALSVFTYHLGDWPAAEAFAWHTLDVVVNEVGARTSRTVSALNNLGFFLGAQREIQRSVDVLAHALALRRDLHGTETAGYGVSLLNYGQLLRATGREAEALVALRGCLALRLSLGDEIAPKDLAITRSQIATVLIRLDRTDEASAEIDAALVALDEGGIGDDVERATILESRRRAELRRGDAASAIRAGEEAVAMHRRLSAEPHPALALSLRDLAYTYLVVGRNDDAERAANESLALMDATLPPDHAYRAELHTILAEILIRRGDSATAEPALRRAAEIRRTSGRVTSIQIATDFRRIALLEREIGNPEGAVQALESAVSELSGGSNPPARRIAALEVELAEVLVEEGEFDRAHEVLARATRALEQAGSEGASALASANVVRARLNLADGALDEALSLAQGALRWREGSFGSEHPSLIEAAVLSAEIEERRGDLDAAAVHLERALAVAEAQRTRVLGGELQRAAYAGVLSLDRIARRLAAVHLARNEPGPALAAVERGRERALLDLIARAPAADDELGRAAQEADRVLLGAEDRLRAALRSKDAVPSDVDELTLRLDAARAAARESHARLLRGLGGRAEIRAGSAPEIVASLREGELLWQFIWGKDVVAFLLADASGVVEARTLAANRGDAERIDAEARTVLETLRDGGEPDVSSLSERLLGGSVADRVSAARRLLVVPDGPMHELPLEVLELGGRTWTEVGPPAVVLPSSSYLARERRRSPATSPAQGAGSRRAVVLGAPQFGEAASDLAPLVGAGVEASGVGDRLESSGHDVVRFSGQGAQINALREAARGARVLHLATHGVAGTASSPYDAGLWLSPSGAGDDGFLALDDLVREWAGRLEGCELVTLSACDTQRGARVGESQVTLSWGAFFAGADALLASRWRVDDVATALLMDRFYESWLGQHATERSVGAQSFAAGQALPASAALLEAKAWLASNSPRENRRRAEALGLFADGIQRGDDAFPLPGADPTRRDPFDFSGPRYWAPFVLHGAAE